MHGSTRRTILLGLLSALLVAGCKESNPPLPAAPPAVAAAQMVTPANHLRANYANLDLSQDKDLSAWKLLDTDLGTHSIFLMGTRPGVAASYEVQWQALKYVSQKAGVTRYLAEMPNSVAELINQYLYTGEESILAQVHSQLRGTPNGVQEGYEFWRKLYAYNLTLPAGQRIYLVGIDAELTAPTAYYYLQYLAPAEGAPAAIAPLLREIAQAAGGTGSTYTAATNDLHGRLQADLLARPEVYRAYLGNRLAPYELTLKQIGEGIRLRRLYAEDYGKFNSEREQQLMANFSLLHARHPGAKYLGQWGMDHTYLKEHTGPYTQTGPRFGQWLNQDPAATRGKVLTIAYAYSSAYALGDGPTPERIFLQRTMAHTNLLEPFAQARPTLFKLTGENSPFGKELFFVEGGTGGVSTDYFQYLVYLPGAEAARPFAQSPAPSTSP